MAGPAVQGTAVDACTRHLEAIGWALRRYEAERGELPARLAELYPVYLPDPRLLRCPCDRPLHGAPAEGAPPAVGYAYQMSDEPSHGGFFQLGPWAPAGRPTWREEKLHQRVHFGERVPTVICFRHRPGSLNLTPAGWVYYSRGDWAFDPHSIGVVLDRLRRDLDGGPEAFLATWAPTAVEDYATYWVDAALPPWLRHQTHRLAERLVAAAPAFPDDARGALYRLAAMWHGAAGQFEQGIGAAESALRCADGADPEGAGPHEGATFLLADLRHRRRPRRRGDPPRRLVEACLRTELARQQLPSLAVAVIRHGRPAFARAYGLANLELPSPATADTVYELASVTKQFTAVAVMLLVAEGAVALDDPLATHLPGTPPAWRDVTVRHLLTHTSGIPNYVALPAFHSASGFEWRRDYSAQEFLRVVADAPLDFPPGEQCAYSNTGYYLLGFLIERLSARPYGTFLAERIFRPLGMRATRRNDRAELIPGRAAGYTRTPGGLRNAEYTSATWAYAEGGLVSSVADLVKWESALVSGTLLPPETLRRMWTAARLDDGTVVDYGCGWRVTTNRGRPVLSHGGGKPGFATFTLRLPDEGLAVVVLTNRDGAAASAASHRVARLYRARPAPLDDTSPETTRRLRRLVTGLAAGEADPSTFTPQAYAALVPRLAEVAACYRGLGRLSTFRLLAQEEVDDPAHGHCTWHYYDSVAGGSGWIHSFAVTRDARVAALELEPA